MSKCPSGRFWNGPLPPSSASAGQGSYWRISCRRRRSGVRLANDAGVVFILIEPGRRFAKGAAMGAFIADTAIAAIATASTTATGVAHAIDWPAITGRRNPPSRQSRAGFDSKGPSVDPTVVLSTFDARRARFTSWRRAHTTGSRCKRAPDVARGGASGTVPGDVPLSAVCLHQLCESG